MVFLDTSYENKIENNYELKKYSWQKNHLSNQTGTEKAYFPNRNKNVSKKKIQNLEKLKYFC